MKSRATLTHGTAKNLADHGVGYTSNGESEYSRNSARPGRDINLADGGKRPRDDNRLLRETEKELAKLERSLARETNSIRLAKLRKNLEIKTLFIVRLKNE
jgi:hypothetical protein